MKQRPQDRPESEAGRRPGPALALMGAGLEFAGVVGLLALAGWWLDGQWNTGPWLMLTGLAVGLIGETYKLWRLGKKYF